MKKAFIIFKVLVLNKSAERKTSAEIQGIFTHVSRQRKKKEWSPVKRLSIDEISMHSHKEFKTVVSNIDTGKLLEVIDSHQQIGIIEVLMQQTFEVRRSVEEVSVDLWGGFPKVIKQVFPNARIVFDRFHVMLHLNQELNTICNQVGVKGFKNKSLFLKNGQRLKADERERLKAILRQSPR